MNVSEIFIRRPVATTLLSLGIARWRNPERPKAGWVMAVSRERARQIIVRHVL